MAAERGAVPRLVVAGVSSGVGKTTVTLALTRAFAARGLKVATFKCGPDYLDPTYHTRASGSPCLNLDGWMMGREAVQDTFLNATVDADIAIIEGVMGLFDGASVGSFEGSTAEIAQWLDAPVLLTLDASGMAGTVDALVRGFVDYAEGVNVKGVICNRVGSKNHLAMLKTASKYAPVLGGFTKDAEHAFPERHLGLYTASQNLVPDEALDYWGRRAEAALDLDDMLEMARSAPVLSSSPSGEEAASRAETLETKGPRIAVALDEAFHFYYEYNLRRLERLGAELVYFSPLKDEALPEADAVMIGGGYPELFAEKLTENEPMRESLRAFAAGGGPVYAECGGLMYVSEGIQLTDGVTHEMVGLIPGVARMRDRIQALGYVEVKTERESPLGPVGSVFRGHQFRYSEFGGIPEDQVGAYSISRRRNGELIKEGYFSKNVLASYVHAHWASNPQIPENFLKFCGAVRS